MAWRGRRTRAHACAGVVHRAGGQGHRDPDLPVGHRRRNRGSVPHRGGDKYMSRLEGKVAIVTAAGRGIATLFAEEGANIVVASLGDAECKDTVAAIVAAGGTAVACPTNVGNKDD